MKWNNKNINKEKYYFYPAILIYEEGQEIAVVFPDLNCATSGIDEKDAIFSAKELLGCVLNGLEEDGEEIPEPTKISDIKLEKNQSVILVEVFMPVFREKIKNSFVKKTLSLPYWLNAEGEKAGLNFSHVLQEALKEKLNL